MDNSSLQRWRSLDAAIVLLSFADHAKKDASYRALRGTESTRWHASVGGQDIELLLTGTKFWDTRSERGGGGAVDLVMHIRGVPFKTAVRLLEEHGL